MEKSNTAIIVDKKKVEFVSVAAEISDFVERVNETKAKA